MAAVEYKLVQAAEAKGIERRGQRQRMVWLRGTAASYAVDTVFLALFAFAGTVPAAAAIAYGAGAAAVTGIVYAATLSNWNLRLRDPSMVLPSNVAAIALQFAVAFAAPQITFPWLANLFTVLAFGVVWLSLRASGAVWALCTALGAWFFYSKTATIGVPSGTTFEITLVWLYFSLVLGRCVFLSVYATSMRNRVTESRRKLAASLEQIQELVSYDELTKAFNRRSLIARLEQERASAARTGIAFSVALLDLDHFKAVNDTHGHAAGDEVLKALVKTVHATMRESDVFGRYGGEEFLMILTDTAADAALSAMKRIRLAAAAHDWSKIAPGLAVTFSAGVSEWRAGEGVEQMLNRADGALYQAKSAGRNCARAA
jgi:diguanylate cyclase (GGDEF)-like protein